MLPWLLSGVVIWSFVDWDVCCLFADGEMMCRSALQRARVREGERETGREGMERVTAWVLRYDCY